jgi:hypothetical protein
MACSLLIGSCSQRQLYVSSNWDFSAAFPGSPVEEPLEARTAAGEKVTGLHVHSVVKSVGDSSFGVVVILPPAADAETATLDTARELVEAAVDAIVRDGKGQVVRQGPIRLGSVEGYEFVAEAGKGRARFLVFAHRGRIYQVQGFGDRGRAVEIDAFVDSFRLR